jgi:transposase
MIFRLKTGCQWKAIPDRFGSGSALHRRFQQWVEAGVFRMLYTVMVHFYDARVGVDLSWCSMDGSIVKAPKGGSTPGPTPPIAQNPAASATF